MKPVVASTEGTALSITEAPDIHRKILDSLHVGVCLLDRQHRITFWNRSAERITGYQRHDVVGHLGRDNILALCNEQACALCGASCPLLPAFQDGKATEVRIQIRHRHGHRIPVRLWIEPIRDEHGSILGTVQSFDNHRFNLDDERKQYTLAAYGCLDETTGLPNHGFTQFHLRENLASFTEYHLPFGIMLIHIDQLDRFEASYGKVAGVAILRVVSDTMRNSLRPNDFLGRWGDGEFLAILPNCADMEVQTAGERIRKVVTCAGLHWWGDEVSVSTSIGYASVKAEDTPASLLVRAQRSLDQDAARRVTGPPSVKSSGAGS